MAPFTKTRPTDVQRRAILKILYLYCALSTTTDGRCTQRIHSPATLTRVVDAPILPPLKVWNVKTIGIRAGLHGDQTLEGPEVSCTRRDHEGLLSMTGTQPQQQWSGQGHRRQHQHHLVSHPASATLLMQRTPAVNACSTE